MKALFTIIITLLLVSCFSLAPHNNSITQVPSPIFYGSELFATQGESEIVINSTSNNGILNVYLNGALERRMLPQDRVKLIVRDGQHTLLISWDTRDDSGKKVLIEGEPLKINISGMQQVYNVSLPVVQSASILVGKKVRLNQVSENVLTGRLVTGASIGIEGAVIRAFGRLIPELPAGAAVAVLNISSDNKAEAASAIDELELQLVKQKKFKLVDRKQLDILLTEQKLQTYGLVSDESAVSIGRITGAKYVITGNVSGSGTAQRLTLKVLNVESGVVVAMEREAF